jgi:hypothetical protein
MAKSKNTKGPGAEGRLLDVPEGQVWSQPDLLWAMKSDGDGTTEPPASPEKLRKSKISIKAKSAAKTKKLQKTGYEIGYAKPPVKSQFKPGQSGNVKGRPRKKPKLSTVPQMWEQRFNDTFLEEGYRTIQVRDGDKTIKIPVLQAVMRRVYLDAMRGDHKSQKMVLGAAQEIEGKNYQVHIEYIQTLIELKKQGEDELEYCKRHNLVPPEMIPHPANIVYNSQTGLVHVIGPMTKEDMASYRRSHESIKYIESDISIAKTHIEKNGETKAVRQNLESLQQLLRQWKQECPGLFEWINNGAL